MECQASLQMPLECSCWVIYGIPKNPICVHYTVGNNYNGFNGHILFNFKHAKQRAFLLVQNATKDNKRKWQQLFTSITKIRLWYSAYFKCSDVKRKISRVHSAESQKLDIITGFIFSYVCSLKLISFFFVLIDSLFMSCQELNPSKR